MEQIWTRKLKRADSPFKKTWKNFDNHTETECYDFLEEQLQS